MADLIENSLAAATPYISNDAGKITIFRPTWHDKVLHFRLMPTKGDDGAFTPLLENESVLKNLGPSSPLLQLSMAERVRLFGGWIKVYNVVSFARDNAYVQIPITDVANDSDAEAARNCPAFVLYRYCRRNTIRSGDRYEVPFGAKIGYMAVVSGIVIFDGGRPVNPPHGMSPEHSWPIIQLSRSSATAFVDMILSTPFQSNDMLDVTNPLYVTIAKASYFNKSASSTNTYAASFLPRPLVDIPVVDQFIKAGAPSYTAKCGRIGDVVKVMSEAEQIECLCSSGVFDPVTLAEALNRFELPDWVGKAAAKSISSGSFPGFGGEQKAAGGTVPAFPGVSQSPQSPSQENYGFPGFDTGAPTWNQPVQHGPAEQQNVFQGGVQQPASAPSFGEAGFFNVSDSGTPAQQPEEEPTPWDATVPETAPPPVDASVFQPTISTSDEKVEQAPQPSAPAESNGEDPTAAQLKAFISKIKQQRQS